MRYNICEVRTVKRLDRLLNEANAKRAAAVLRAGCYLAMAFQVVALVLACLGRQTFVLNTGSDYYENAIYAEADHEWSSHGFTVSTADGFYVSANNEGEVDLTTHIGLTLMFAAQVLPAIAGFWLLSRVFANISQGTIFAESNARCLLGYGLLQLFIGFCLPFVKLLICALSNFVSASRIALSAGLGVDKLFPGIAFLVAAYIIHYGIALQDEVDHTL